MGYSNLCYRVTKKVTSNQIVWCNVRIKAGFLQYLHLKQYLRERGETNAQKIRKMYIYYEIVVLDIVFALTGNNK